MKPEQYDRLRRRRDWTLVSKLDARGVLSQTTQRYLEGLQPPEIVGQVENPALETFRRFWWQAFDQVCNCIVLKLLSIHDRIFGPEPPTPADLKREADHERLVGAFPMAGEAIEPRKSHARHNLRRRIGSPLGKTPVCPPPSGSTGPKRPRPVYLIKVDQEVLEPPEYDKFSVTTAAGIRRM
jgi:hypothetical protein